ncbi:MAG TPA: hypothetical protein VGV92_05020 [Gammaproteobacteria bacterium]|nr:hypothetical protein [Gammaproteobacteria bacterium]
MEDRAQEEQPRLRDHLEPFAFFTQNSGLKDLFTGRTAGIVLSRLLDQWGILKYTPQNYQQLCLAASVVGGAHGFMNELHVSEVNPPNASVFTKLSLFHQRAFATRMPHSPGEGIVKGIMCAVLLCVSLDLFRLAPFKGIEFLLAFALIGSATGWMNEINRPQRPQT